ncbi:hypothetical protein FB446DRAFT_705255 [Lentinula raphanica]|nr:hypothetical protein FB446DRAFT_705255 [Lentinula raphanica]
MLETVYHRAQATPENVRTLVQREIISRFYVPLFVSSSWAKGSMTELSDRARDHQVRQEAAHAAAEQRRADAKPPATGANLETIVNILGVRHFKDTNTVPLQSIRGRQMIFLRQPEVDRSATASTRIAYLITAIEVILTPLYYASFLHDNAIIIAYPTPALSRYPGDPRNISMDNVARFFALQGLAFKDIHDAALFAYIVMIVETRLPASDEYSWVIQNYSGKSYAEIYASLTEIQMRKDIVNECRDDPRSVVPTALAMARNTNNPNVLRCTHCKRRGHDKTQCYAPGGDSESSAPPWYRPPRRHPGPAANTVQSTPAPAALATAIDIGSNLSGTAVPRADASSTDDIHHRHRGQNFALLIEDINHLHRPSLIVLHQSAAYVIATCLPLSFPVKLMEGWPRTAKMGSFKLKATESSSSLFVC